ncbi:MAG TPA: PorP/SprF family type IX secretion system membrane protein [Chryseosolibacter sp.]|nr:PorP/SprF family type IX secretion system membrane protein [Chryseosolibacter sp.]
MTKVVPYIILICVMLSPPAAAQYFQFTQYNFSSQRIAPTAPASSDYASLSFLYRNQATAGDIKLNSNLFSASYPLLRRNDARRWAGIGMTMMDDRSGGIFRIQEASLSYAVNVFLDRFESLSLGVKGLYQQRRIDLGGLFTGSQYVPDRGFDPDAFNGETIGTLRSDFVTFSAGLSWQRLGRDGIRLGYWSVSWFDFNKPDNGLLDKATTLPSTWVASAGFRALRQNNLSVFPEVLFTRNAGNNVLNVGIVTRCDVRNATGKDPFHVDVITKYVAGRSGIFGLQFHNETFSIGFSYDFLVHKGNAANLGAMEIGLELRRRVVPQVKNKLVKKATPVKPQTQKTIVRNEVKKPGKDPANTTPSQPVEDPPKPTLVETLHHKRDSVIATVKAGDVRHKPFEIEKVILHFNFEFNSSELDEASTTYLDELMTALAEDPHLKIRLTGHTDNVGSASFNLKLSKYRANSIKKYLVSKGVEASRIAAEGKGLTEPLNDNRTEADRAKNRRVELTIFYEE